MYIYIYTHITNIYTHTKISQYISTDVFTHKAKPFIYKGGFRMGKKSHRHEIIEDLWAPLRVQLQVVGAAVTGK